MHAIFPVPTGLSQDRQGREWDMTDNAEENSLSRQQTAAKFRSDGGGTVRGLLK